MWIGRVRNRVKGPIGKPGRTNTNPWTPGRIWGGLGKKPLERGLGLLDPWGGAPPIKRTKGWGEFKIPGKGAKMGRPL